MTDEEISKAIDKAAQTLYVRGMTPADVALNLRVEVERACEELENEENDFSR